MIHMVFLASVMGLIGPAYSGNPINQINSKLEDGKSVLAAIQNGLIGIDFAEAATKDKHLSINKVKAPGVPFNFYVIDDYRGEYTVMVEKDHLVLLCFGFGGGRAHDFVLQTENDQQVLAFQFESGSGLAMVYDCRYLLGSGTVQSKARPFQPNR